jgi:hypothetical protein
VRLTLLVLLLLLACPASDVHAEVIFRGDFETCDTAQWRKVYAAKSYSVRVVRDWIHEGKCGARFEVWAGDMPIPGGDRAMVVGPAFHEGQTVWFRWSTRFAVGFPKSETWAVVWELHQQSDFGTPPVELHVITEIPPGSQVKTEEIRLRISGKDVWRSPLVRSQWYDFVLGLHLSTDGAKGWAELYVGGMRVLARTPARTMLDHANHLLMGYYRKKGQPIVGVVYHDGLVVATKREDVMVCE